MRIPGRRKRPIQQAQLRNNACTVSVARMTEQRATTLRTERALAAYANPARISIIDLLRVEGPATAGMLATRLGIASGSASHHLKVLAEADLITERPELASDRRERWWAVSAQAHRWSRGELVDDEDALAAADAAEHLLAARQAERVQGWLASSDPTGPWSGSAFSTTTWLQLTPTELADLGEQMRALLARWSELSQERTGDGDPARSPVYLMARGFPSTP